MRERAASLMGKPSYQNSFGESGNAPFGSLYIAFAHFFIPFKLKGIIFVNKPRRQCHDHNKINDMKDS
jgi:hypothetical protein